MRKMSEPSRRAKKIDAVETKIEAVRESCGATEATTTVGTTTDVSKNSARKKPSIPVAPAMPGTSTTVDMTVVTDCVVEVIVELVVPTVLVVPVVLVVGGLEEVEEVGVGGDDGCGEETVEVVVTELLEDELEGGGGVPGVVDVEDVDATHEPMASANTAR
jgi:hypothetical protein